MNGIAAAVSSMDTANTPAEAESRSRFRFSITFHKAWMIADAKARRNAVCGTRAPRCPQEGQALYSTESLDRESSISGHLAKKYVTDTIRTLSPKLNLVAVDQAQEEAVPVPA
jgi:hypothetical protein